ncbi:MAG: serine/threonine protein kinase [Myxococcota bacterium]|jgi:serine/threonine protein kinase
MWPDKVLRSLWEAHEHALQIIHRDIKPANIVLVDLPGETDVGRVLDFGIARSLAGSGAGTQGIIGTPFYMAPELWKGELVDARTDLYALVCVMLEMLAGAPPFQPPPRTTEILLPLLGMHCHDDPPSTLTAAPSTPAAVAAWVDGLLKKDKDARPPSASVALAALEAAAERGSISGLGAARACSM